MERMEAIEKANTGLCALIMELEHGEAPPDIVSLLNDTWQAMIIKKVNTQKQITYTPNALP